MRIVPVILLVVCMASLSVTASLASERAEAPHAVLQSNVFARTGGFLFPPAAGPCILFLNAQQGLSSDAIRGTARQVQEITHLSCAFTNTLETNPITAAAKALIDPNVAVVVVLCQSSNYPSLLIAPESRWALVNVADLGGAGTSTETQTQRVQKEMWRALGYLMGGGNSEGVCLLKPIFSSNDLDALKIQTLSPEPFNKIFAMAQKLGMKPLRLTTYKKAVEEGWAPAPTNDFQRAIWQETHK